MFLLNVSVRPDDLANLCALYSALCVRRIVPAELERYAQKSMLLDSSSSASQIIQEATKCGLLSLGPAGYFLTDRGRQLGKCQKEVRHQISEAAKDHLIKKVYLNVEAGPACCRDFLTSFRADAVLQTFVFDRKENELLGEARWLRILSRVGLLEVSTESAKINRRYLDAVNYLLRQVRDGLTWNGPDSDKDREKIGKVAEKCALDYEM